jgi:F420-0:gamma-glutamyl ligase-like protein
VTGLFFSIRRAKEEISEEKMVLHSNIPRNYNCCLVESPEDRTEVIREEEYRQEEGVLIDR